MDRRSIAELTKVDSRTSRFGPQGLMTDRRLTDESAVEYIQAIVENLDLPATVPEGVRQHFDTLRHLHTYGSFSYDLFGLSASASNTALEFVLGVRFVEWHGGCVPLTEHRTGASETMQVHDYAQLRPRLGKRRRADGSGGWHLEGDPLFDGSLASLLRWARSSGVLRPWLDEIWARAHRNILSSWFTDTGRENRVPSEWQAWSPAERTHWIDTSLRPQWEEDYLDNLRELRNLVVHRTSRFLTTPVESAKSLRRLAELIGSMWPQAKAESSEPI